MRRPLSQRVSAVVFTLWFALVGLEPAVVGVCPTHNAAAAGHIGHGAAATHHGVAMHSQAPGDDQAPAQQKPHQCTCPGSCCGPNVVAVPELPASLGVVACVASEVRAAEHVYRASWTDFVLPFATAPPPALTA